MIRTAMSRPVTVCMFVVAIALFGLISLSRLSLNLLPEVSYPTLTIQTDFPDAAPEEVESLVTRPIEEAVGVVGGLTRLSSISRSGQSEVILEYGWKTNMDLATLDAREKLDLITLPRDVERPVILRFDPSQDPIMRLQLYGDMPLSRLRYVAEKELKRSLESTRGVAAIKVQGGIEEQIHIEIDEKRLAEMGIPITRITQILAEENLNQASGSLYDLDSSYLVRILNQFRSVEEIKGIVIRNQEGRRILLGDVATIWRGEKERDVITRYGGKESVELAIFKEGDANTVTVVRAVLARLDSLKNAKQFPEGVDYAVVFNQSEFIENAVNDVLWAAVLGGILAIAVLFLFLRHLRSTVSIGLSIPISIMATFALMYQTGLSLNIMSLGGIALGVGMLVDSSIVVLEAVHRHRQENVPLFDAVHRGATEVGPAVLASTLTTIAVFLPMIFVEGIAGQLFKDQALTITYSLAASLVIALTFLPMLLALKVKDPQKTGASSSADPSVQHTGAGPKNRFRRALTWMTLRIRSFFRFLFGDVIGVIVSDLVGAIRLLGRGIQKTLDPFLNRWERFYLKLSGVYPSILRLALDHKGMVFALVFLLVVSAALISRQLGTELIPPMAQGEFSFELRLPHGTPLQRTQSLVAQLENRVSTYPEVEAVFSNSGQTGTGLFIRQSNQQNMARLFVVMKDRHDKDLENQVIERIRSAMEDHPELTYTFSRPALFSFKTPVEVEIYGYDLDTLRQTADQVAERLSRLPGLSDISTTTEEGYPELLIQFDRERLARYGLEEGRVAQILRNKIRGDVASRFREEDRQIEILVRAHEADRNTVESIRNLVINSESIVGTTPTISEAQQTNSSNSVSVGNSSTMPSRLEDLSSQAANRNTTPG
ncbi:MAG TPA: efflux RND transporter permease subunit, partial [Acidobacteriota bacterium]|nr:efflux RND transporter permease subunit [Acidobacteriota bacterium]